VKSSPRACADYERIWAVVSRIPRGRVATYGQIARLAGLPRQARRVGYALAALPADRRVPWHRVINAQGAISARGEPRWAQIQRELLRRERVAFDERGLTDLARYAWKPRARR
jgi:methylated-DNA-protein-cysteine methyltransferase related protein